MSLSLTNVQHYCSDISRKIEGEFDNLTLDFLLHRRSDRELMLEKRKDQLLAIDKGKDILKLYKLNAKQQKSECLGLVSHTKEFLKFFSKESFAAVFCINIDDFNDDDELKHEIYRLLMHAFILIDEYEKAPESLRTQGNIIFPAKNQIILSQKNMLADSFGAILMQHSGLEGYIEDLAIRRSKNVLSPIPHHHAELYPFPIAYEACEQLYNDLAGSLNNSNSLQKTRSMVYELSQTYKQQTIEHWYDFAYRAQKMAWSSSSPDDIIGAAIYSSDETHIQSNATTVSHLIDISPQKRRETDAINYFKDEEENKDLHYKNCDLIFFRNCNTLYNSHNFLELYIEAIEQCQKMTEGYYSGWCVTALIAAAQTYKNTPQDQNALQNACNVFYEDLGLINWEALQKASDFIFNMKRNGKTLRAEQVGLVIEKTDDSFKGLDSFIQKQFAYFIEENKKAKEPQHTEFERPQVEDVMLPAERERLEREKRKAQTQAYDPNYEDRSPLMDYISDDES